MELVLLVSLHSFISSIIFITADPALSLEEPNRIKRGKPRYKQRSGNIEIPYREALQFVLSCLTYTKVSTCALQVGAVPMLHSLPPLLLYYNH
jgi:hypothetical protein